MAVDKSKNWEVTKDFEKAKANFPHLKKHLENWKGVQPKWYPQITRDIGKEKFPNLIYPIRDPIFIHVYREPSGTGGVQYIVVEPRMNDEEIKLYDQVVEKITNIAYRQAVPSNVTDVNPILIKLLEEVTDTSDEEVPAYKKIFETKVKLTKTQFEMLKYYLIRDRTGYGKLEALLSDPNLEDIHCTGVGNITTIHKMFGLVHTNIEFKDDLTLDKYIAELTERVERPASDAHAVVDAIMPDGSRANFIYGKDISQEGSSFTIRKFSDVPVSITQVLSWGTMSYDLAAYLWLALENGMNMFVCGETASGKTTTLNACCVFIKPDAKIYTVENTPEVTMPHDVWQHLVTRESGKTSDVGYQDLLIAALRSRPNYIIVGEIRGKEGSIAFQAMQTGHPVLATFHAGNVVTMIQRLNGDPINVPLSFMNNLNICLIQQAVSQNGKHLRRVLSISELERYYEPKNKVITREVFTWDPVTDTHLFRGNFNSFILEQKIAKMKGYSNPRQIYADLQLRKKILIKMVENKIFNYFEVWDTLVKYYYGGEATLPFKL
jgi:archaeal flagellar protein FlaI